MYKKIVYYSLVIRFLPITRKGGPLPPRALLHRRHLGEREQGSRPGTLRRESSAPISANIVPGSSSSTGTWKRTGHASERVTSYAGTGVTVLRGSKV